MKTTKTVIVALGLLIGGLAQAEIFDDFSSGNLMDNWSTTSTDTGLKWTIKITGDRNNQNILALAYWLWNPHFHGTQTLDRALGGL